MAEDHPYRVTLYPSLAVFYREADPRLREFSMERDYGVHWTDPGGRVTWPRWRVSWIFETGELYAVNQIGGKDRCPVRVYGVVEDRDEIEVVMAGWEHECWKPGSLGWLEARFAKLAAARLRRRS